MGKTEAMCTLRPRMDLETENKNLLTIINNLKRFNYED